MTYYVNIFPLFLPDPLAGLCFYIVALSIPGTDTPCQFAEAVLSYRKTDKRVYI